MGIRDVANSLGYVGDSIDLQFVLDVPLPEAKLDELEQWAREKSARYQVVTWRGLAPPEWRETHLLLYQLEWLAMPLDHRDLNSWTADNLDGWLRAQLRNNAEQITALVVHSTGAPAATTRLIVEAAPRTTASQYGPTLLSPHFGHRLSALAEVALLRRLGREFPHIRSVYTEVDVEDEALWAVNDRIGFRSATPPLVD
jgi:hypothetical protein